MLLPLLLSVLLQAQPLTISSPELRLPFDEFKKLHDAGKVLVVDTRGRDSYLRGHIPDALSLPLDRIAAGIPGLKEETRPIVTYCS
ncbi:MAG TPA: rhodanese-like domain-containing protein [Vicinamibacterales bacterium]|nr:rhodanese-like domain-containing protein [Vicinamibacterales bacterium]